MGEPYRRKRTFYQDQSGSLRVATTTNDTTLATTKTNHTTYLQKLHVEVTAGSMGVTWSFTDTAGSPVPLVPNVDAAGIAHFDFDFGPEGIPLTEEEDLLLNVSGTGAAGWVSWEAYQKITKVAAA